MCKKKTFFNADKVGLLNFFLPTIHEEFFIKNAVSVKWWY